MKYECDSNTLIDFSPEKVWLSCTLAGAAGRPLWGLSVTFRDQLSWSQSNLKPACLQRRVVPLQCRSCHDNLFCKHLSYPIKCLTVTAREGFPQHQKKKKRSCPLLVSPLLFVCEASETRRLTTRLPATAVLPVPSSCCSTLVLRLSWGRVWSCVSFGGSVDPPTHGCGRNNGGCALRGPFCCGCCFALLRRWTKFCRAFQQSVGVGKDEDGWLEQTCLPPWICLHAFVCRLQHPSCIPSSL